MAGPLIPIDPIDPIGSILYILYMDSLWIPAMDSYPGLWPILALSWNFLSWHFLSWDALDRVAAMSNVADAAMSNVADAAMSHVEDAGSTIAP